MTTIQKKIEEAKVVLRTAVRSDAATVFYFIKALAEYEKLSHEIFATQEIIEEHLFGDSPKAEVLLAEVDDKPVGFALFFYNFSTFLGKPGIYIEDIFVEPEYRGFGIGKKFFKEIAKLAVERDCGRLNWWVLNWNEPSINFYLGMGSEPQSEWTVHKLEGDAIRKLADS